MCEFCENLQLEERRHWQKTAYMDIGFARTLWGTALYVRWHGCPPYPLDPDCNHPRPDSLYLIKYCPECGRRIEE